MANAATIPTSFITNAKGKKEYLVLPMSYLDEELIEDICDAMKAKQKLKSGKFTKI